MLTEFTITILTEQDADMAENDIRKAIRAAGYDIANFITDEVEVSGQDRESYSDDQDRENYTVGE